MRKHEEAPPPEPEDVGVDWVDERAQQNVDLELVYQAIRAARGKIGEWKIMHRLAVAGVTGGPRQDAALREIEEHRRRLTELKVMAEQVKASEHGLSEPSKIVIAQADLSDEEVQEVSRILDGRR